MRRGHDSMLQVTVSKQVPPTLQGPQLGLYYGTGHLGQWSGVRHSQKITTEAYDWLTASVRAGRR